MDTSFKEAVTSTTGKWAIGMGLLFIVIMDTLSIILNDINFFVVSFHVGAVGLVLGFGIGMKREGLM